MKWNGRLQVDSCADEDAKFKLYLVLDCTCYLSFSTITNV